MRKNRSGRALGVVLSALMAVGLVPGLTGIAAQAAAPSQQTVAEDTTSATGAATKTEDAALAEAKRTGAKVEIPSLRAESSEVYATPEGNFEAVEHLRPVRTRVDGEWKSIDTSLEKRADGTVGPKMAAMNIAFSGGGDDQPLVTLERAGRELALSWPTALPAPVLDGDTATYPAVLPGVDLRVRADIDGISQLLVVRTPEAAADPKLAELRLAVDDGGMTVKETKDGGLAAVDPAAGGAVFEAPQPVMWDSSTGTDADSATAGTATGTKLDSLGAATADEPGAAAGATADAADGPGESAQVAPIGVEVTGGGDELVLTPDQKLLTGDNTTYPVYIDPQWYTPKASNWAFVSRYWHSSPMWHFNGDSDAGMGYCAGDSRCAPSDVKRLFYQIPTSRFAGKTVLSAEFVVKETHSYSCDKTDVQLWRTKGLSKGTDWDAQSADGYWVDLLKTVNEAKGWSGDCPGGNVEFWATRAVQQAAANNWSTTTFGLRAKSETDPYAWKRFSDDAWLRVEYNRPPAQIKMSQLTQDPGGACAKPGAAKRVRILPKIVANNVTDPDKDSVSVQFQASWDSGDGKGLIARWTSARSTYKKSGSDFSISLPSTIPKNKTIGWHARSYDSAQWSPWSYTGSATSCNMVYDTSVPAGPSITSTQYPVSDPEDPEDPWVDGVGRYGTFTIDSTTSDVTKYWFGVNGDPTSAHTLVTTSGGAKTMKFMPTKSGVNYITAQAFDAAGNGSEIRTYQFRVRSGQPERLKLDLNENAGATSVSGTGGDWPADLQNGTTPGGPGVSGNALHFDGVDDYAATTSPVLNTGKSFSVSLWAKLPADKTSGANVALSQAGSNTNGFQIYHSSALGGWVFLRHATDAAGTETARAVQPACPTGDTTCVSTRLGTWTHLVGVFENSTSLLKLYVNGALVDTTPFSTPWDARGRTFLGAVQNYGVIGQFFPGDLDEAQLFDYPLTATQITKLYGKLPVGTGRSAKVVWPLDEDASATTVTGRAQTVKATVNGGATLGGAGVDGTALTLDGTNDVVRTAQPVLDTYQSFAVSTWVRLPKDKEQRAMVAVTQGAGGDHRGFELYHSSALGGWVFSRATTDDTTATTVRALQSACAANTNCAAARLGEWTHVVGVYDIDAQQMRLYVDGVLKDTVAFTTPWLASDPVTLGAADYVTGPGNFLKGDMDDVRLFDRAISDDEVKALNKARPVVQGRWKLDAGTGSPVTTLDDTTRQRTLTLGGNAAIDISGSNNYVGTGGLVLDGDGDYAAAAALSITTDTSFTAAAWASTTARPDHPVTLFSQTGKVNSGFVVRYVPDATDPANAGRWQLDMPGADTSGADSALAEHSNFQNNTNWNHLAVVYDAFADEMRLYVDGELRQSVCVDDDADGAPDVTGCTDAVSWNSNVLPFNATGGIQLGRSKTGGSWGEFWPGVIDDVWAIQGVASDEQIARLANGEDLATVPGP